MVGLEDILRVAHYVFLPTHKTKVGARASLRLAEIVRGLLRSSSDSDAAFESTAKALMAKGYDVGGSKKAFTFWKGSEEDWSKISVTGSFYEKGGVFMVSAT